MSQAISQKKFTSSGRIPAAVELVVGELGVNIVDGIIYSKDANANIINLSGAPELHSHSTSQITGLDTALSQRALITTSISAGNGLTGGGALSANRTLTMGTPATITSTSTNAVTATSHSHSLTLSKADIGLGSVDNTADVNKTVHSFIFSDTRAVVSAPDNLPSGTGLFEFKNNTSVGNPPKSSSATYSHVLTTNGLDSGGSGGWPTQISFGGAIAFRKGASSTTWGAWSELLSTDTILATTGQSTSYPMTQKAVTDGFTNLNASNLTTGTIPVARFPTLNQNTTGNAATATILQTARTINGVSFNGSANITVTDNTKLASGATAVAATKLATARTINGVPFDGTANITVTDEWVETTTAVSKTLGVKERCVVTVDARTITLPANPATGTEVVIAVGNFEGTVISRNGRTILGVADNAVINNSWATVHLYFDGNTWRFA